MRSEAAATLVPSTPLLPQPRDTVQSDSKVHPAHLGEIKADSWGQWTLADTGNFVPADVECREEEKKSRLRRTPAEEGKSCAPGEVDNTQLTADGGWNETDSDIWRRWFGIDFDSFEQLCKDIPELDLAVHGNEAVDRSLGHGDTPSQTTGCASTDISSGFDLHVKDTKANEKKAASSWMSVDAYVKLQSDHVYVSPQSTAVTTNEKQAGRFEMDMDKPCQSSRTANPAHICLGLHSDTSLHGADGKVLEYERHASSHSMTTPLTTSDSQLSQISYSQNAANKLVTHSSPSPKTGLRSCIKTQRYPPSTPQNYDLKQVCLACYIHNS